MFFSTSSSNTLHVWQLVHTWSFLNIITHNIIINECFIISTPVAIFCFLFKLTLNIIVKVAMKRNFLLSQNERTLTTVIQVLLQNCVYLLRCRDNAVSFYAVKTLYVTHTISDKNSHIFKHFLSSPQCKTNYTQSCFRILDTAHSSFSLKLKEALYIKKLKPDLNKQIHHL